MSINMGVWIDHRDATIVTLDGQTEASQRIESGMEKHVRFGGGAETNTAEDNRDRRFTNHLNLFFEEVINLVRTADSILIMGPGEAKGELVKRLEKENLGGCVSAVETVDKLTDPQVAARVREYFAHKV